MNNEVEILLVEDNPSDAELAMRAFRKNKIANNVIRVCDGEEALDHIFARGQFMGGDMIESYRLGVNSYLFKPVDFDKFIDLMSNIYNYWPLLNQLPNKRNL